ncbi:MAG TPA: mitochondrial fission ELM1 family protein, partial [Acidocella sp.]|nr:mitochondrial fission ELM1 family protein [Acidocella sp.]
MAQSHRAADYHSNGIDGAGATPQSRAMISTRILCTDLAGLRAQALGLAEVAGLEPDLRTLVPVPPWDRLSPSLWVKPRWAVQGAAIAEPLPGVVIGCGGAGARVAATLRRPGVAVVAIQHPRMALDKFDFVMAARHDGITGPNVIVTRTALHRVTQARLAAEKAIWEPRFAARKRPLVAVLLGGSNGRYRFEAPMALELAIELGALMQRENAGVVITPSRRTAPDVVKILRDVLEPRGAWIWDGTGENPYFGMLACADAIIATADSVSMVSEAVATSVPVFLVRLPGKSKRIGAFMDALVADGRVKDFAGRLELWNTQP